MKGNDIKPRIDFTADLPPNRSEELSAAYHFDEQHAEQHFTAEPAGSERGIDEASEITLQQSLRPRYPWWGRLLLLGMVILLASGIAQLIQTMIRDWQDKQWFDVGLSIAGGMIVIAAIGAVLGEFHRLRRLKKQMVIHQQAQALLLNPQQQNGVSFCERLLKNTGLSEEHPAVIQWRKALDPSLSDREVLLLYSRFIQPVVDNQASRLIRQTATQSALMVAASPYALVDMGFVAWRSLRMINQIARLYHIEPGYLGRIRLLRSILVNMAVAGASEWIQESSVEWISQDLAARLSARVAQGVGIGLLTARLGIKTMALCRPIPWPDGEAPKVSEFRRGLLADLKDKIRTR